MSKRVHCADFALTGLRSTAQIARIINTELRKVLADERFPRAESGVIVRLSGKGQYGRARAQRMGVSRSLMSKAVNHLGTWDGRTKTTVAWYIWFCCRRPGQLLKRCRAEA